jgi:hypothetical protein
MCIDNVNGLVYIHGGYDGEKCLDDFWIYSIKEDKWQKLCDSTHNQNGPGPRSCHKMTFDAKTGIIYVLGRLADVDVARAPASRKGPPSTCPPTGPFSFQRSTQAQSSQPPLPSHPTSEPPPNAYSSDFYFCHTSGSEKGTWKCISLDTAVSNTPVLPKSATKLVLF